MSLPYGTWSEIAVSVTTASTLVLAANGRRRYAFIQNDSAAAIYIALGEAAVLNSGIRLNANGGYYEMSKAFGNLNPLAIYAIGSGTGVVCGCEGE